jgi:hypothetical protein
MEPLLWRNNRPMSLSLFPPVPSLESTSLRHLLVDRWRALSFRLSSSFQSLPFRLFRTIALSEWRVCGVIRKSSLIPFKRISFWWVSTIGSLGGGRLAILHAIWK